MSEDYRLKQVAVFTELCVVVEIIDGATDDNTFAELVFQHGVSSFVLWPCIFARLGRDISLLPAFACGISA